MYLLIIYLPLISAVTGLTLGRFIGERGMSILGPSLLILSSILSLLIYKDIIIDGNEVNVQGITWMEIGGVVEINWGLKYDSLTATMLIVVLIVSTLVHIYSTEYMAGDPHKVRFISYLSLFTFFMLILVTSSNYLQLFIGWEGVGLCSYLLINFWTTRILAGKAAIKAMVVNRIGDVGLVLAMFLILWTYNSLDYSVVFSSITDNTIINIIVICMLIASAGKSAQMILHTWLPDAMEGPTPVSALIHAATMVTAGVFLIIRSAPLIENAPMAKSVIVILGAMTALMAASIGLVQSDIKRVIAYSTCSQLGYMVLACGLSNYSASLFHLMNHAFFKALLFLSAGSVIHSLLDEQDMRAMGGLVNKIPFTYSMMLIGSLSLMGFPFLSGFYSKDTILELSIGSYSFSGLFAYVLGTISAIFTAAYSGRLLYNAFIDLPKGSLRKIELAAESSYRMAIPLIILAIGSIYGGYILKDIYIGMGTPFSYYRNIIDTNNDLFTPELLPTNIKLLPVIFSILGGILTLQIQSLLTPKNFTNKVNIVYTIFTFLSNKWHFDFIYNKLVNIPFFVAGYNISYKLIDKGLLEQIGPTGLASIINNLTIKNSILQSGLVTTYAFSIVVAVSLFLWTPFLLPLFLAFVLLS